MPPPLAGIRVVVTRAAHQADATVRAFEEAGALVPLLPLLELVPPEDPGPLERALAALGGYDWIVFTSTNAVERVLGRPGEAPPSAIDLPAGLRVASVGGATSDALRDRGVEPHLEPADARAEGLAAELVPRLAPGARVLLPQAADARPVLAEELAAAGARLERVDAYAKRTPPEARERAVSIFGNSRLGWVTFTSPSIARAFARLWGEEWPVRSRSLLAASIGPVTSAALRELGIEPAAEAAAPGDEGLVAAVVEALAGRGLGSA
jgi:uroporphyrinogen III methyltransferase/synthase